MGTKSVTLLTIFSEIGQKKVFDRDFEVGILTWQNGSQLGRTGSQPGRLEPRFWSKIANFERTVLRAQSELGVVVWFFEKLSVSPVDCASLLLQIYRLKIGNRTKREDKFRYFDSVFGNPGTTIGVHCTGIKDGSTHFFRESRGQKCARLFPRLRKTVSDT